MPRADHWHQRLSASLPPLWERRPALALALFAILLLPPVRHALEARMTVQMLVQLPLLVLVGWWWAAALPARLRHLAAGWNQQGLSGLLLASLAAAYWMLPRAMDAALSQPWIGVARYVSVPLLIGLPFALSWPRMGFIVRGVFLLEFIASFFRLGWLYLASPVRVCSNYLIGDQQYLGRAMVAIGMALTVWMGWKLLWGRFSDMPGTPPNSDSDSDKGVA